MSDPVATQDTTERARLLRLATYASVATAAVLTLVKLAGWLMTGSVSLLASLTDSLMDTLASAINLVAVRVSLQPADDDHRFGHGKAESLAGLGQATFVAGSAAFVMLHAVDRLLHPVPIQSVRTGVLVMIFAIALTSGLLLLQRYVVRRTGSTAIRADALHYGSDLLANLAIIAALVLAQLGMPGLDPLFAIVIAFIVVHHAWRIGAEAVHTLMDRELPQEIQANIRRIALAQESVLGVHEMRTRQSGAEYFVQLHLELADEMPLVQAHGIADEVEEQIRRAYPNADVLIHQDPVSVAQD